jgi:quercetin dioxygenase-like cupin family protein
MSYIFDFNQLKAKELFPGINAKIAHSDKMTIMHVSIDKGAALPEHHHPQEQWTNIISGKLEMTINGKTTILEPGMVVELPSNMPHSARALTDCEVIDVFNPPRNDLR